MILEKNRKATLQAVHTDAVNKAVKSHERYIVLAGLPPSIRNSEKDLTMKERLTITQLRSGYCELLDSYKSRIRNDISLHFYADHIMTPHDGKDLFVSRPTKLQ